MYRTLGDASTVTPDSLRYPEREHNCNNLQRQATQNRLIVMTEKTDMDTPHRFTPTEGLNELVEEGKKIRRLQVMISMVMSVIGQDPNLTIEEASELAAGAKRAALAMFPDKELAYDLLYKPRLQRLMNERFHLQ